MFPVPAVTYAVWWKPWASLRSPQPFPELAVRSKDAKLPLFAETTSQTAINGQDQMSADCGSRRDGDSFINQLTLMSSSKPDL
ncbi:hypothetical protein J6590_010640 [Homalodisca vitripennis]|nr:hypothetical protein J6590_010640 [Homalodisca vitripennis]